MIFIDRSIVRQLVAVKAETLTGFTVRHAGEHPPDAQDKIVLVIERFTLERMARASDDDADIAEIECELRVEIGSQKVLDNIYAMESAMSMVVAHFMPGALVGDDTKIEWATCRDEDLGELEAHVIRAGRVTLRGHATRWTGTDIEDFVGV